MCVTVAQLRRFQVTRSRPREVSWRLSELEAQLFCGDVQLPASLALRWLALCSVISPFLPPVSCFPGETWVSICCNLIALRPGGSQRERERLGSTGEWVWKWQVPRATRAPIERDIGFGDKRTLRQQLLPIYGVTSFAVDSFVASVASVASAEAVAVAVVVAVAVAANKKKYKKNNTKVNLLHVPYILWNWMQSLQ